MKLYEYYISLQTCKLCIEEIEVNEVKFGEYLLFWYENKYFNVRKCIELHDFGVERRDLVFAFKLNAHQEEIVEELLVNKIINGRRKGIRSE